MAAYINTNKLLTNLKQNFNEGIKSFYSFKT